MHPCHSSFLFLLIYIIIVILLKMSLLLACSIHVIGNIITYNFLVATNLMSRVEIVQS